jgi:hypothetical protein
VSVVQVQPAVVRGTFIFYLCFVIFILYTPFLLGTWDL